MSNLNRLPAHKNECLYNKRPALEFVQTQVIFALNKYRNENDSFIFRVTGSNPCSKRVCPDSA